MDNFYSFTFNPTQALTALKGRQHDDIKYYNARNSLFKLSLMADYDQLVCLPSLTTIDKHWYQIETARKVLRQFGGRALLADEVGLGKTIEAGLIRARILSKRDGSIDTGADPSFPRLPMARRISFKIWHFLYHH
jgi:SNF2 family DNA or RNA helicase